MSDQDLSPQDLLQNKILEQLVANVHMSMPAVVVNVDDLSSKQSIDVLPLINEVYEDYIALQPSEIYDVPVVFPSAGGGLLSFPVKVGDTVELVFSRKSIGEWLLGDGGNTTPETFSNFSLTDAVAIVGLYTQSSHLSPNPTDVELKFAGSSIRIEPSGHTHVDSSDAITATAVGNITLSSQADINITAVGNVNVTGALINLN